MSGLDTKSHINIKNLIDLSPIIAIKIFIQPVVTFVVGYYWLGMESTDIYLIVAILMSAQPIGAGVYVFANKFEYFQERAAVSIIISLLITVFSLSFLLETMTKLI